MLGLDAFEAEFELGGTLFATVRASIINDWVIGAHVNLDGNVLGDTGLRPFDPNTDDFERVLALRRMARVAIAIAHRECGMEMDYNAVIRTLALALPVPH